MVPAFCERRALELMHWVWKRWVELNAKKAYLCEPSMQQESIHPCFGFNSTVGSARYFCLEKMMAVLKAKNNNFQRSWGVYIFFDLFVFLFVWIVLVEAFGSALASTQMNKYSKHVEAVYFQGPPF